jgi:membrane protein DedA with SNARE-associated domain
MIRDEPQEKKLNPTWFLWLERLTAATLVGVVLALGWILGAAYVPEWAALASVEAGVVAILVLLTAALALVSVVALLHTRA